MALAAHAAAIRIATTDVTGNEIDGINNVDWGPSAELLETTDFKDTTAARTRIQGLKDLSLTLSGDHEAGDTNGQVVLRDAYTNGTTVFVRWLPNGTVGFKCEMHVQEFKISGAFDGKVEFSATLVGAGAIGTV